MRGRKPKPIEVHEANGNPSKKNLKVQRAKTPRAPDANPNPPAWLSTHATRYWRHLFPALEQMRVMTLADESALAELCEQLGDIMYYRTRLHALRSQKEGDLVEGSTGNIQLHPYARQVVQSARVALRYMAEFGLTPSSRSRIQIDNGGEVDDLLMFVAGMN